MCLGDEGAHNHNPKTHVWGVRNVGEGSGTVVHGAEQLATMLTGAALVREGAGFESRPTAAKCVLETSTDVIEERVSVTHMHSHIIGVNVSEQVCKKHDWRVEVVNGPTMKSELSRCVKDLFISMRCICMSKIYSTSV